MELFDILLAIHIAGGGISLLLGTYLLIIKKGDKTQQKPRKYLFLGVVGGLLDCHAHVLSASQLISFHSEYFHDLHAAYGQAISAEKKHCRCTKR